MRIKTVCAALVLLSLCGSYATARGISPSDTDPPSVKVSFGDLDLSNANGGRVMLLRIRHAAKAVCGSEPDDPIWRRYEYNPCVNRAIDQAVARLHSPVVTALNGGKGSKDQVALASR